MTEMWKSVVGFEDLYLVSDLGRVFSLTKQRVRKTKPNSTGYSSLTLCKNGRVTFFHVHVLVALAFLGPRPTRHVVNHLDGDKTNPALTNLEYCTYKQNSDHAIRTGLRRRKIRAPRARKVYGKKYIPKRPEDRIAHYSVGTDNANAKLTESAALSILERLDAGHAVLDIAADYGVTKWAIYNLKRGIRWKHVLRSAA